MLLDSENLQFIYEWNTEKEKMIAEFSSKEQWPNASVFPFHEDELCRQLLLDEQAGRQVVVVLTASTNYPFARSQIRFFSALQLPLAYFLGRALGSWPAHLCSRAEVLQTQFPSTVVDVFPLGHCMYGCDSCSVHEHQVPLFFTRYFTK